ncbi:MAG: hypothetical protein PHX53_00230 [Syntrophales bacterium]|nr:hypothetical protein [Syntrophales bacterium]
MKEGEEKAEVIKTEGGQKTWSRKPLAPAQSPAYIGRSSRPRILYAVKGANGMEKIGLGALRNWLEAPDVFVMDVRNPNFINM